MPRARGQKQYISMAQGLITEASPLAAPEGSTSYEVNMQLDTDGMVRTRRKGLGSVHTVSPYTNSYSSAYFWESMRLYVLADWSDDPDTETDTVTLYFKDPDDSFNTIGEYSVEVDEDTAQSPTFSEIRNRLVVSFGGPPFLFEKRPSGMNAWYIDIYIRDFKLLDDNLSVGTRPLTLTDNHEYNLLNAGWYRDRLYEDGGSTLGDPITVFFDILGEYPSNADIVYLGERIDTSATPIFSPVTMRNTDFGNTEAPRGHYVYNIRDIDRNSKLTDKDEDGTPSKTITQVLEDDVNISGNPGNLLYVPTAPDAGTDPVDPPPPYICQPGEPCKIIP